MFSRTSLLSPIPLMLKMDPVFDMSISWNLTLTLCSIAYENQIFIKKYISLSSLDYA